MNTKTQKISAIIASFVMVAGFAPYATAQTFQTTGTFALCSANITPSSLDYGQLEDGLQSSQIDFGILNDGNVNQNLTVFGQNWVDPNNGNALVMVVGTTAHSSSNGFANAAGTALTTVADTIATGSTPGSTHTEYFNVLPASGGHAGVATQDVTFSFSCP